MSFYYRRFIPYIQRTVKHDYPAIDITARVGFSAFTDDPLNEFMKGPSSIGKSFIIKNALSPFPKKHRWFLGGMSPKAIIHDPKAVLVDEDGKPLTPPDVPPEQDRLAWKEFNERKKRGKHLIDLKNMILVFLEAPHIETFDMLRPILSHDEIETEYKIAPRTSNEKYSSWIIVRNWPAMICSTTALTYLEDMATRSLCITPKESETKYAAANLVTAQKAMLPPIKNEDVEFKELKLWVEKIIANENMAISPQADVLAKDFPHHIARDMRDLQKYLSLVKNNAILHYEDRPQLKVGVHIFTLTTLADYLAIDRFWYQIIKTTQYGISSGALDLYEKILKPLTAEAVVLNTTTIGKKFQEVYGKTATKTNISSKLTELVGAKLLEETTDAVDKRRKNYLVIDYESNGANKKTEFFSHLIKDKLPKDYLTKWLEMLEAFYKGKGLGFNHEFRFKDSIINTDELLNYLNSFKLVHLTNLSLNNGLTRSLNEIERNKLVQSKPPQNDEDSCAICGKPTPENGLVPDLNVEFLVCQPCKATRSVGGA